MENEHYLTLLGTDAARLADVAAQGLDASVPACPGWTVDDAVRHTADVYLHKVECMRRRAFPDQWPPDLSDREPLALFREAYDTLVSELRARGPEAPSATWWPPDQTVGFWYRRMAQETAVHRVDVESAHDQITPVDAELAADGVDEMLQLMLAGDWSDEPIDEADGAVVDISVTGTYARAWRVTLGRTNVECVDLGSGEQPAGGGADATVTGPPSDVLLWLWGRAPIDRLTIVGDRAVVDAFRQRSALATQ